MARTISSFLIALGVLSIAPAFAPQVAYRATAADDLTAEPQLTLAPVKPYRTFIHIQRFSIENSGEPSNPISNVKLGVEFPNGTQFSLPGGDQYWPIGNGQMQEIDQIYELPFTAIQNDGFKFTIQIYRKGSTYLPCKFDVSQLSQFNRAYVCHTDIAWQTSQNIPEDQIEKQGVQVRIFTDLNSRPREIPQSAIALR